MKAVEEIPVKQPFFFLSKIINYHKNGMMILNIFKGIPEAISYEKNMNYMLLLKRGDTER